MAEGGEIATCNEEAIQQEDTVMQDTIQQEDTEKDPLTIIVIGRTGVGKSALVNSLLGDTIDREAIVTDGLRPTDHDILEKHEGSFCGEQVVIYDTKGLGNPRIDDNDLMKHYLAAMRQSSRLIVLICQKLEESYDTNRRFAKLLARHFGDSYNKWKKCIFVLTKANQYILKENTDEEDDLETIRETKIGIFKEEWKIVFGECLCEYGVPGKIISGRPVCIAGLNNSSSNDWIKPLFEECKLVEEAQKYSASSGRKLRGAVIGAAVGGIVLPLAGAPIGFGAGWYVGKKSYMNKIKKKEIRNKQEKYEKQKKSDRHL
uniref:AIG1-type G domain-containing protein n=1 Tax=Amphimedon queenslandica TaxID=400682 RepID=A0A1X7UBA7_AMPQE